MYTDILIIGAGVTGCALARELSAYQAEITVAERCHDAAEGASKANSGIVHAGFDAKPGTMKARMNVRGAQLYPDMCAALGVRYAEPGALVLGFDEADRGTLKELTERARLNGVPGCRIIEREEILELEPNINPEVGCALLAETSGIVSPYELTYALADHAALNGVRFRFGTEVQGVERDGEHWRVRTSSGEITCRIIVNCAGTAADKVHNAIVGREELSIIPRRGQYYLLDHMARAPFAHTIFQCPGRMGKGVLVSPTVHGNVLIGPSAEDIEDEQDTSTTQEGLAFVLNKCRLSWPGVSLREAITNFSGVRAHETGGDFRIGHIEGCPGAYDAAGIESPGLTSAPAIAEYLCTMLTEEQGLLRKDNVLPPLRLPKPFSEMDSKERIEAIASDPAYANVLCRCEVVTEAEIRAAIRRPVGATTVDGVKRRVRAGMGRCQGGFCSPRVMDILAEELGIPVTEVRRCGGDSRIATGMNKT